jgi:hypothetical protein
VPRDWLRAVFLTNDPTAAFVLGPLVGPAIAVVSFVCSVGNVPLAAVLWNGGISFGGVMAFVFADLLILPILAIYRRYYGTRAMLVIAGTFYLAMALAGYVVEVLFGLLHLVPTERSARVLDAGIAWDYTTWLDIVFLAVAVALLVVFIRSGGWPMLAMMGGSPDAGHEHAGHEHAGHGSAASHAGHEEHAGHGHLHEGRPSPPS